MYYLSLLLVFLLSQIALASNQIVLIGAPGAGKGTLAAQLKEALNIPHISSGDIVRAEIFAGTEFGKKVVEYNNKGQLLPDTPEFMGMLFEALKNRLMKPDCDQGFILDGIPRTEQQAHQLEEVLKKIGKALDSAILIDVSNQTLLDRLAGRVICKTCNLSYHMLFQPPKHEGKCDHCEKCLVKRSDDCLEVVLKRLDIYEQEAASIIDFYRKNGLLRAIDGEGSADDVFQKVMTELN